MALTDNLEKPAEDNDTHSSPQSQPDTPSDHSERYSQPRQALSTFTERLASPDRLVYLEEIKTEERNSAGLQHPQQARQRSRSGLSTAVHPPSLSSLPSLLSLPSLPSLLSLPSLHQYLQSYSLLTILLSSTNAAYLELWLTFLFRPITRHSRLQRFEPNFMALHQAKKSRWTSSTQRRLFSSMSPWQHLWVKKAKKNQNKENRSPFTL